MDFKQIKVLAWNGATPEQLDKFIAPEHTAYQAMRFLFQRLNKNFISKEDAEKEARKIEEDYNKFLLYFNVNKKGYLNIVASEGAIAECGKNADDCEHCRKISALWGFLDKTDERESQ